MHSTNTAIRMDAYEAVARLLTRTLTVPQVFFEPTWPESQRRVDIMAIDRAGSGDVHVVELKTQDEKVTDSTTRQLLRVPAHYRWLAVPGIGEHKSLNRDLAPRMAESGIGLIGVVAIANGEAGANVISRPRRAESFDRTKIGEFLKKNVPDIEYGEAPRASNHAGFAPLPKEKIVKYLDDADWLLKNGHQRAGYLLAWSATEAAMLRLLDANEQTPLPTSGALVRTIGETGRVTASEVESLRNALNIRNMLAHGVGDPGGIREAYRLVTKVARKLVRPQSG